MAVDLQYSLNEVLQDVDLGSSSAPNIGAEPLSTKEEAASVIEPVADNVPMEDENVEPTQLSNPKWEPPEISDEQIQSTQRIEIEASDNNGGMEEFSLILEDRDKEQYGAPAGLLTNENDPTKDPNYEIEFPEENSGKTDEEVSEKTELKTPLKEMSSEEAILYAISQAQKSAENDLQVLQPFVPGIQLTVIRGIQTGTVWTLGYGPREIGTEAGEFPIIEKNSPGVCFSLHPTEEGVIYKTLHSKQVKLNDNAIKSDVLESGDIIKIGDTAIEVETF